MIKAMESETAEPIDLPLYIDNTVVNHNVVEKVSDVKSKFIFEIIDNTFHNNIHILIWWKWQKHSIFVVFCSNMLIFDSNSIGDMDCLF